MNLTQTQTQIQLQSQTPESLENLFVELADLYFDYRRDKPSIIIEDMELLDNYKNFPEKVGKAFLEAFGKVLKNGV